MDEWLIHSFAQDMFSKALDILLTTIMTRI